MLAKAPQSIQRKPSPLVPSTYCSAPSIELNQTVIKCLPRTTIRFKIRAGKAIGQKAYWKTVGVGEDEGHV